MRIGSPLAHKKARIEIIPLIDIMFFLLASFMMVSLTMIKMQSLKMDLPTATQKSARTEAVLLNIDIDAAGQASISNRLLTSLEVYAFLTNAHAAATNLSVYIRGHPEASHGAVISVVDTTKRAGIAKVSFSLNPPPTAGSAR